MIIKPQNTHRCNVSREERWRTLHFWGPALELVGLGSLAGGQDSSGTSRRLSLGGAQNQMPVSSTDSANPGGDVPNTILSVRKVFMLKMTGAREFCGHNDK